MSQGAEKAKEPYRLDPAFERALITLACHRPRFYGRIGHAIDPDCLGIASAKLALEAVRQIVREQGKGPDNLLIVLQRLRRWFDDGRVKLEQIQEVDDMFADAEDAGLPSEDGANAEIAPILKRRIHGEAVRIGMDEYGKGTDFRKTMKLLSKAEKLGDTDTSTGVKLGSGSYEEIDRLRTLERLPTGITELDIALDGGLQRGGLGLYVGGSGDGKSMSLSAQGAQSVRTGLFVVAATLEVPVPIWLARVNSNLTGIPINTIIADSEVARPKLAKMPLGPFIVKYFPPTATTFPDIEEWVSECEDQEGRKVDVLLTDYGDKLGAPAKSKGDDSGYSHGRVVFERMRVYAEERNIWHWSASQAVRKKDKKKILDLEDVADSMHKVRVGGLVITLNVSDDQSEILFRIAKHTTGKAKINVGPFSTDYACGRIAPIQEYP